MTATDTTWKKSVDGASLAAFRVVFGLLMAFGMARFLTKGWVTELYLQPKFFFTYPGFSWIQPFPEPLMYAAFILLAVLALMIAAGWHYRIASLLFFLLFTYVELIDKSNYLNHYYFISLLAFLFFLLPLNRVYSLDALRNNWTEKQMPFWVLAVLRLQVGLVYFFAGIAKLNHDWLFEAQPLKLWLRAYTDFPLLGPLFEYDWTAYAFSWLGAAFDLTIPFFLLNRRTRPFAYAAVVFFHIVTWKLFPIGMFPWIMMMAALVFFDPDWPHRLKILVQTGPVLRSPHLGHPFAKISLIIFFLAQILIPLRSWLYPGNANWTEEGFRFSWKVMVIEKNGLLEYEVREPATGKTWIVQPETYLCRHQLQQMKTQPDMILQFANFLENEFEKKGISPVEIHADSLVSYNGRSLRPLVNPEVNLASVDENLFPKNWLHKEP